MSNFDIVYRNDHEGWLCDLNKAFRSGLDGDIASEGDTTKSEFSEGHVNLDTLILARISNFISEALELAVKFRSMSTVFLFLFELGISVGNINW